MNRPLTPGERRELERLSVAARPHVGSAIVRAQNRLREKRLAGLFDSATGETLCGLTPEGRKLAVELASSGKATSR